MADVDAIVLDLDGGPMLAACLDSLFAQSVPFRRVIVFDNGSRTPVLPRAGVKLIRSHENLGFTGGVNAAYAHATAEFVALINNDVVLDADWLSTVLAAMTPRVAAVQTVVRRDAQTIDGAGIDASDGTFRQIGHGLPLGSAIPEAWGVSATATLYRRAALGAEVFDPRFFAYYEDVELSARLRAAGWELRVLPEAKASHRGSQTRLPQAMRLRTRNRYWVARKHRVGRIGALLWEDLKLLIKGKGSLRGVIEGLTR